MTSFKCNFNTIFTSIFIQSIFLCMITFFSFINFYFLTFTKFFFFTLSQMVFLIHFSFILYKFYYNFRISSLFFHFFSFSFLNLFTLPHMFFFSLSTKIIFLYSCISCFSQLIFHSFFFTLPQMVSCFFSFLYQFPPWNNPKKYTKLPKHFQTNTPSKNIWVALVFRSPVRSGFFAFFGQTGTGTGSCTLKVLCNRDRTDEDRSSSVHNRHTTGFSRFQLCCGWDQSQLVPTGFYIY